MKLAYCLIATAVGKNAQSIQVLEDLATITSRFDVMTTERTDNFPQTLLDSVLEFQADVINVENNSKELQRALASAANLNLQLILSALV